MTQVRAWLLVSLVVLALLLGWAIWSWREPRGADPAAATLVPYLAQLFGEPDSRSGRLSRGPDYDPVTPSAASVVSFAGGDQLLLAIEIERRARAEPTAEHLHSLGLFRLFEGRYDNAIEALRASRLESPAEPSLAGDLASAYLARASHEGDSFDILLAAEAATQAVALDPDLPEARFNLALALHELHLERRARQAWEEYLELDSSSEWAHEGRNRLASLDRATEAERWAELVDRLERVRSPNLEPALLEEISSFPFRARVEVEERLLPKWADFVFAGDDTAASQVLSRIELIGSALAKAGDHMVADELATLQGPAREGNGRWLLELARAHRDAGLGLSLSHTGECARAEPLLADVEAVLRLAGSPIADQVAFRRVVCRYSSAVATAKQDLQNIIHRLDSRRYPTLLGRVSWMMGACFASEGDFSTALSWYRSASDHFGSTGDSTGLAGLQPLIVEVHRRLGQHRTAWRQRLLALPAAAQSGDPKGLMRAFEESLDALVDEERIELAILFQDELLARSLEWTESPTALPSALLKRASLYQAQGEVEAALRDLEATSKLASILGVGPTQDRFEADIAAASGQLLMDRDPSGAHRYLTAALDHYLAADHRSSIPGLLAARARASLHLGDPTGAEHDLREAIRAAEERRTHPGAEAEKISFFETFQPIYESMVRYQAEELGDPGGALAYADLFRARALLDRTLGRDRAGELHGTSALPLFDPELVPRLQQSLPDRVAIVEYAVLPEKLLLWVVRKDGLDLVEHRSSAKALERQVNQLREAIRRRAEIQDIHRTAGKLFEALVRPVMPHLTGTDLVILIPDRFLFKVPFAALWDTSSGRYWIQDQALALTPSAAVLLNGSVSRPKQPREEPSVLVVASPTLDRARFIQLAPLPGALREGQSVAARYLRSQLLSGADATPEAVLESLSRSKVLHLAAHVVVNERDPSQSLIALAPGDDPLGRGALSAAALGSRDLTGVEVAFLSACSSATVFPDGEREGIAGLARELLAAKVPSVIGTLWEVDDEAGLAIATGFHRSLATGMDPASALRSTILPLLEDNDPRLRSPAAWSSFQLFTSRLPTVAERSSRWPST
jgi:CHAT domain-containing protein/TPR repeat protein